MKMSIAHCYFIAIEFVKYARKSLLKEYRLDAPRISAAITLVIVISNLHYITRHRRAKHQKRRLNGMTYQSTRAYFKQNLQLHKTWQLAN